MYIYERTIQYNSFGKLSYVKKNTDLIGYNIY